MKFYDVCLFGSLSDDKFISKISPLVSSEMLRKVYLFRYKNNCMATLYPGKIRYQNIQKHLPKKFFFIYAFLSMLKLCMLGKVNLLISVYFYPYGMLSGMVSRITGVPVIHIMTGSDLRDSLQSRYLFKTLSRGTAISVRGEQSKATLVKAGLNAGKITIHRNIFEIRSDIPRQPDHKYDLIFVGGLTQVKRLDRFIEIVLSLRKRFPDIQSVIVGDGPDLPRIKEEIFTKSLTDNIETVGFQADVYPFLVQSRIFLLTSESEGLPMAIIEAMSCGLPVIAPAINDIPDLVIHEKNGFLVPSTNVEEYCRHITALLENNELYRSVSSNALSFIAEYSSGTSLESLRHEWQQLLADLGNK